MRNGKDVDWLPTQEEPQIVGSNEYASHRLSRCSYGGIFKV